jgi:hypothetical protein
MIGVMEIDALLGDGAVVSESGEIHRRGIQSDYPMAKTYLLHPGRRRETQRGVTIAPLADTLAELDLVLSGATARGKRPSRPGRASPRRSR